MKNTLSELLKTKGKTRYWLWKETGLAQNTAYRVVDDQSYIPGGDVMDRICSVLSVQPGEWLVWLPEQDD